MDVVHDETIVVFGTHISNGTSCPELRASKVHHLRLVFPAPGPAGLARGVHTVRCDQLIQHVIYYSTAYH